MVADVTTSAAADQLRRPPTQRRTEQFDCPDCGHRFRARTKAGVFSRCPKCSGQAIGTTIRDRIVASAGQRVAAAEAARSARRRPPKDGPPALEVNGGKPLPELEAEPPAANGHTPGATAPRRRPSPTVLPLTPPPMASAPATPTAALPPSPEAAPASDVPPKRGLFDRILGAP